MQTEVKLTPEETKATLEEMDTKTRQLICLVTSLISLGISCSHQDSSVVCATGNQPEEVFLTLGMMAGEIQIEIDDLTNMLLKSI